jgi:HAD superfamily hydrolase (TIGR01509 family)
MKKGAVFDMDGLLIDSEAVYQKMWKRIAAERGIDLDPAFGIRISGSSRPQADGLIEQYYHVTDGDEIYQECVRRVADELSEHAAAKPGAYELAAYLKKKGVKAAVASSTKRRLVERNLEKLGLRPYFDAVVGGEDVRMGKPHPDIFLKAAGMLGLSGKDCYVLEDAYNGVRAGHAAGSFTIMVPDQVQPDEEIRGLADAVCHDLYEVKEKMEEGVF